VKVGDIVIPSSSWLSQGFYDAEEFGIGLIIEEASEQWEGNAARMYHIKWSGHGVFNSWEYDFELEVISEAG